MEAASGIARIAEFKMADIIRKTTVEKRLDRATSCSSPSAARAGACGGLRPRARVQKVIVPQKEIASTWCAFGAASATFCTCTNRFDIQASPFDAARVNARSRPWRKGRRADGP